MPDRDLPDDLALPLTSGEPWWYWTGGRPAVDFVNTQRERWRRNVETLVTPGDLADWLVRAGVMAPGADAGAAVTAKVLGQARDLREAIDHLVVATIDGAPAPAEAVTLVDDWLVFAGARPQLVVGPGGAALLTERAAADSPRRALGMVALDAAQMLGTPQQRDRIRICASETCSGRFFDRSPGGRRRWCSMRTCGNEAKARRHRARQRATSSTTTGAT
jgi:predicted RNA-binding Zn ribbon-like protein